MTPLDELMKWAEDQNLSPDELDDLIHDLHDINASEINNGGLEEQLGYILANTRNIPEAVDMIRDYIYRDDA